MPILTNGDVAGIIADVRNVITDDTISTDITFMLAGATSGWSPTSQLIPSAMYTESSVSAFRGSYTLREVEESGGLIEFGDVKFIMMNDDVSGVLATVDKIKESGTTWQSGTTYEVRNIMRDPLNIAYFIQCRAV